jgi:hypothetical protein
MSTHFKINYNDWNEDASPISKDVKIKISHRKLVANSLTAERNKDDKFRKKVSSGLKKYFGTAKERFNKTIIKQSDGCWIYPKRWIMDDNGNQLLPKNYSAIIHKVKFTSGCITNTCGNKKCVNPKHLKDYPKEQQAKEARAKRPKINRDNSPTAKITEKDVKEIKSLFKKLLKENNGKAYGLKRKISLLYPVSEVIIGQVINKK